MIKKIKANEGIEYKKLSPEEMKAKGILGRLVGPCADFINPTRNGRKYSEKLWENVFNDDIMKEKIANGVCFGELGHPADRTETDMEKIAICLREQPVKNDKGQLIAIFDILDTPNGRILKTLCDYGSIIGVSSRGQGDLVQDYEGNESVDPDTYDCECFDAVLVPAVKAARMTYMREDINTSAVKMKKALKESLNSATEDDKKIMKETLENLNIKLVEDKEEENIDVVETTEDSSNDNDESDDISIEIVNDPDLDKAVADLEAQGISPADFEDVADEASEEVSEKDVIDDKNLEPKEDNFSKEDVIATAKDVVETVKEVVEPDKKEEKEIDKAVEDKIEEIFPENNSVTKDKKESNEQADVEETEASEDDNKNDEANETIKEEVEANNSGDNSLIESLKEALKNRSDLEAEVKTLNEKLAVSDSKVNDLNSECDRYKQSVVRLSKIAKSTKDLKEEVLKLTESLNDKDKTINSQKQMISRLVKTRKESVQNSVSLKESLTTNDKELKTLQEKLTNVANENESKLSKLNEEFKKKAEESEAKIQSLNEELEKATTIKESYKNLANKTVNKYIQVKANMLGLTSTDIKRKLGESYTLDDIDQVCEDLKSYRLNVSKLPFSVDRKVSVKVNESVSSKQFKKTNVNSDDDVDESLIKLANI